jgi:Ser/Thr protein kinase RdoA (MazF antagonist)
MFAREQYDNLAKEALEKWGVTALELRQISATNNVVYRVEAKETSYVLRVHRPGYRKREWIESELIWLSAIQRDTDLCVPAPAAPIYDGRVGDETVCCTLLHWIEGEPVPPAQLTLEQARQIGVFIGRLHEQSSKFYPPSDFALPYLDLEDMFGANSPYFTAEAEVVFTNEQRYVMDQIEDRVRIVISELKHAKANTGIIHNDLIWKNILLNKTTTCAIDFDTCSYSYYLYDLAPTLLGYKDESHYTQTKQTLWEGYTSIQPLSNHYSQHLDTLIAGRHTLSCWWIAANTHNPEVGKHASKIISHRISELSRYLQTGEFHRGELLI